MFLASRFKFYFLLQGTAWLKEQARELYGTSEGLGHGNVSSEASRFQHRGTSSPSCPSLTSSASTSTSTSSLPVTLPFESTPICRWKVVRGVIDVHGWSAAGKRKPTRNPKFIIRELVRERRLPKKVRGPLGHSELG